MREFAICSIVLALLVLPGGCAKQAETVDPAKDESA
jgi:hypothetical protein